MGSHGGNSQRIPCWDLSWDSKAGLLIGLHGGVSHGTPWWELPWDFMVGLPTGFHGGNYHGIKCWKISRDSMVGLLMRFHGGIYHGIPWWDFTWDSVVGVIMGSRGGTSHGIRPIATITCPVEGRGHSEGRERYGGGAVHFSYSSRSVSIRADTRSTSNSILSKRSSGSSSDRSDILASEQTKLVQASYKKNDTIAPKVPRQTDHAITARRNGHTRGIATGGGRFKTCVDATNIYATR